ncbi:MAG: hypothetical protein V1912_09220 [bacterium]
MNEYISIEKARDIYGVVIEPGSSAVDHDATTELRRKLKAAKTHANESAI